MRKPIDLKSWMVDFLRFKDSFTRTIRDIKEGKDSLKVIYKDREVLFTNANLVRKVEKLFSVGLEYF